MPENAGYLGPDTVTFGYAAAEKYFLGQDIELVPMGSHQEICEAVGKSHIDYGVVAVENSIDGVVLETIHGVEHTFRKYNLCIYGEEKIDIQMFYLQKNDALSPPIKVLSHLTAIRQCSKFVSLLQKQGITVEVRNSTGQAAKEASANPETAVLASGKAANVYGLKKIVQESVTDSQHSITRFWILSPKHHLPTGHDKTCIFINLEKEKPGVLYQALGCFAQQGVNLLTLYPNPILGREWEYTFILEFAGHIFDASMDTAYENLNDSGICVGGPILLGAYPVAA